MRKRVEALTQRPSGRGISPSCPQLALDRTLVSAAEIAELATRSKQAETAPCREKLRTYLEPEPLSRASHLSHPFTVT
jgi:hypothetical protein